ncbi:protein TOPAZ1-like [Pantherophis guttatus]|uniref:Protein TOPAZ1 n=1 Tax=Pantherophis guttatus TaxID=94885 RepID=A0ABM3Z0C6_PANGU|nr:protein TOPAZ1-like [Pantherophis guttatus]
MQEQKTNVQDFAKIENTLTIEPLSCDHQLELSFPTVKAIVPQQQDPALKSRMNDFRFPRKCPRLPLSTTNSYKTWKGEKHPGTNLGLTLPRGYCRYYFNSFNGCKKPNCWFSHVLVSREDKLCSEIIKKYISIGGVVLLQRAVYIFSDYCKKGTSVYHLDLQMFHDLLTSLLQSCLLKELFHVVHTGIRIKILPTIDILLKIFEEVALMKVKEAVPELSDIFRKLIDVGMVLEHEHIRHITNLLNQLHVSSEEIAMLRSRFQERHFHKAIFCDFDSTVAAFKAKKVLDVFYALKIHFTLLKGLLESQQSVSRCQVVNVAVEIFLKCGNLDGALWVLRGSEWIINTAAWPCEKMDVLNRHNLLYAVASELMIKQRYDETFEVLRNLPGFQNTCDSLDVSQNGLLFNKLLSACSESRNIEVSSIVVAFMLSRNIHIEFNLLRALITALGRSCLWLKARKHYKSALALGCYPSPEGNLYRKLLLIPSYMSEVEMLLAIEMFLVSNASSIQSPGASNQILQIVLKRCEGNNIQNSEEYQNATERLFQAVQISNPKLFIKHLTVNINKDQIYSLEYTSVLKWLKENMKWAGKTWLF